MQLERVTIAVTNMREVVAFYNAVFDANLQPSTRMGDLQFYSGKLAGFELVMCPNEIAEVDARQNRQQFRFVVDNLDSVLAAVQRSGGEYLDDMVVNEQTRTAGVRDPDGNTIEFTQWL